MTKFILAMGLVCTLASGVCAQGLEPQFGSDGRDARTERTKIVDTDKSVRGVDGSFATTTTNFGADSIPAAELQLAGGDGGSAGGASGATGGASGGAAGAGSGCSR
jgi:hypothetical protein